MAVGLFSKLKALAQKIGSGLSWVNDKIVKPYVLPAANLIAPALGPVGGMITKGINLGSSAIDAFGGKGSKQKVKDNFNDFRNDTMNRFLAKAIQVQQLNTIEGVPESNAVIPFKNDGEHYYSIKEIKPESQMPALFGKEIIISLSDSDHDITQIQNSFLSIVMTANLLFDNKFEGFEDAYKDGVILFVGLKSGSNIIREYTVYHRGRTIDGSLQNDATTESFIYNTIKPKSEKNNRKHIHSLYENIHKFDTSACGTYITMRDIEEAIADQGSVPYKMPVRFRVSVPLDDLLIFSAFTDYPNGMFGDLKIKFKINP
ncbi:MAG: hypothetical protein EZS28_045970, partial [Streblomastix strix]